MTTHAAIRTEAIDADALIAMVEDSHVGAMVVFRGIVRDHDMGRGVNGIAYSSHPDAERILGEIAAGIAARDGVDAVAIEHRVGDLGIGDDAMVAVVSAAHRSEAFRGCADLVDEVKAKLPVWKNQEFSDGTTEWTGLPDQN